MQIAEAFVAIRPDSRNFAGDVQRQVEDPLRKAAKVAAGLFAGIQVKDFLAGGLRELEEQQKVLAQTEATIKSTGGAANVTADQVAGLAANLQDLSGKDAEAIQAGENLLLTFKSIRNEAGDGNDIFNQATKTALDLSVAWGQDMTQSAVQLGKALEDPVVGMTALQRVGVTFTQSQKDTIKQLVATGKTLEAQKLILQEVNSQVGGSAEAYGQTLPGKLERARNALDDLKANIVASAAPAIESLAEKGQAAADLFGSLPQPMQATIVSSIAVGAAMGPLRNTLSGVADRAKQVKVAFVEAGGGAKGFSAALSQLAKGGVVAAGIAAISSGVNKLNDEFNQTGQAAQASLPDPSRIDDYIAAVNKLVGEQRALSDQISGPFDNSVEHMGDRLSEAGKFFGYAVTGGTAFGDSIAAQSKKLDAYNAVLAEARPRAQALADRTRDLAGALGISGTEVKDLVGKFQGLDISQVPMDKLVDILGRVRDGSIDTADAAQQLGVKVRTAGDDAKEALDQFNALQDGFFGVVDAERGVSEAFQRITDAQRDAAAAARRVGEAQESYNDSLQRVRDAEQDRVDSLRKVADAQDAVTDAQRRLDEALAGPSKRDEIGLERAKLRVEEARKRLEEAQKGGDAMEVKRAQLDLDEAQLDLQDRQEEQARRVADATDDLESAQRSLADAQDGAAKSARDVEQAHREVTKAAQGVSDAQYDAAAATTAVRDAQYDAVKAVDGLSDKQFELTGVMAGSAGGARQLLDYILGLKAAYPQLAAELDPLIDKLGQLGVRPFQPFQTAWQTATSWNGGGSFARAAATATAAAGANVVITQQFTGLPTDEALDLANRNLTRELTSLSGAA